VTNELVHRGVGVWIEVGGRCDGISRNALTLLAFSAFNRVGLPSASFLFFQLASNTKY